MPHVRLGTNSRRGTMPGHVLRAHVQGWQETTPVTDIERDMVATAIVDHIKLCNWKVERGPPWSGFAYLGRGPDQSS
jgi:hypothetical protein